MPIRPLAVDALLAAAPTTIAVLMAQEATAQGWPPLDAPGYVLVGAVNFPLVARSRAPVTVALTSLLIWFGYITAGYWPVVNSFGPMLAIYTVASLRPARVSAGCAVLMAAVWIYAGALAPKASMVSVVGQAVGFAAVLWWFGTLALRSAELTRRLRREKAERARRAVAEERSRIARELHDVVAHHMSVISVQAGLGTFVFESDPPTARTALDTITGTSAEALEELRRMLQVLRAEETDGAPPDPMPGLARLGDLVERVRAGGVPVELRIEGTARPLAPGVELCAYRVVQEALTNVIKHARQARVMVVLHYGAHEVAVSVVNDGQGVIQDRLPAGPGLGLIGMRERAKLYGGTIRVGPRSEGGFAVRLTLPTSPQAGRLGDDAQGDGKRG
ncbi:sensor histidine kinase [Streptomyces luteolifulvus]|uniref:histidine kinase n=1 Tax=Streptomyces luteolifulvus TaxID=2615112 RepID=A0A6H9UPJ0_9ACTN|nr:sensor histidine kinase [Streptomyces luteolifulvus]KAB1139968.1 sensor histidine kinase [Streptomyces luteolifulvus]